MSLYHYKALDASGQKRKGVLEAHDEKEAKEKLRSQGLMVSHLSVHKGRSSRETLRGETLVAFTMQLSQLINAGIPLYESLVTIEEQYRREPYHRVLLSLCDQIKRGSSLSHAMSHFPNSFDSLYIAMVAAGETAGALGLVLERLHHYLQRQMKMKKEMMTAMIYPSILAVFALLVIALLLGFVVPSIEGIFADRELNSFTAFILGLSHFAREQWLFYVPAIALVVGGIVFYLRSPQGRQWWQRFVIGVPLLGKVVIQAAVARFSRTMGTLLQGGVSIIEALKMARGVVQNVALEEDLKAAEEKVVQGSSLSAELKKSRYIPTMMTRMLAVGEETGNSVAMLNKVADIYEEELDKTLSRTVALAQPAILIVMGGIIGAVMIAILLPLTDVTAFAAG